MPEDTGWQFLCNQADEDIQEAQVWSLREVVNLEPALAAFLNCPVGTTLVRADRASPWKIVEGGDCEMR